VLQIFILQALFQSSQHLYEKREGSGSVPLTNGSESPTLLECPIYLSFDLKQFKKNFTFRDMVFFLLAFDGTKNPDLDKERNSMKGQCHIWNTTFHIQNAGSAGKRKHDRGKDRHYQVLTKFGK
jgi:hypothetical protein